MPRLPRPGLPGRRLQSTPEDLPDIKDPYPRILESLWGLRMISQLIKEWPEVLFFGALFVIVLFI